MKRKLIIAAMIFTFGAAVALAADKDAAPKMPEPPSAKERIERMSKGMERLEVKLKADADLRTEALAEAKKNLDDAKKFAAQGKEDLANEALIKARHHMGRIHAIDGKGPKGPRGGPGMHMMRGMRGGPGMGMGMGPGQHGKPPCGGPGMGMGMCPPGMDCPPPMPEK